MSDWHPKRTHDDNIVHTEAYEFRVVEGWDLNHPCFPRQKCPEHEKKPLVYVYGGKPIHLVLIVAVGVDGCHNHVIVCVLWLNRKEDIKYVRKQNEQDK